MNDAKLLALASDRMAKADFAAFVPAESFYKEFGITQDSLDKTDEVSSDRLEARILKIFECLTGKVVF